MKNFSMIIEIGQNNFAFVGNWSGKWFIQTELCMDEAHWAMSTWHFGNEVGRDASEVQVAINEVHAARLRHAEKLVREVIPEFPALRIVLRWAEPFDGIVLESKKGDES